MERSIRLELLVSRTTSTTWGLGSVNTNVRTHGPPSKEGWTEEGAYQRVLSTPPQNLGIHPMDVALKTCKLEGASHAEIWMAYMSNELKTLWKRSSSYWRTVHSRKWLAVNRRVRLPFCVLKVLGDVLDDGELHFIERARTFEAARRRIGALAGVRPGQYVIYNGETGERVSIVAGGKRGQSALGDSMSALTGRFT